MTEKVKVVVDGKTNDPGEGLLIGGSTMVPVRWVSEKLGCRAEWDGTTRTVNVMTPGYHPNPYPEGHLEIIPQVWVERYSPLPSNWLISMAPGLTRKVPDISVIVDEVSKAVGVDARLLVTRMQLEQSAVTYPWDGSTRDYGGGTAGEGKKLRYLCGVDRTDSGDRQGGWFGVEPQLGGCALRFRYWYRGRSGPFPEWRNWLGLLEDPKFAPGVPVTRQGQTIIPANQASADCLRYTTGMGAQTNLRNIGRLWFQDDYLT
jgi:hypothetical protein